MDDSFESLKEWCDVCKDYVICLNHRCINNDKHITYALKPKERKDVLGDNLKTHKNIACSDSLIGEEIRSVPLFDSLNRRMRKRTKREW